MNAQSYVTIGLTAVGMFGSWAVWVTVMVFELKTKIALMKQEIEVLKDVKEILTDIRISLKGGHHGQFGESS